ncbi:MAG: type II secretion system protein [Undibacterium sp.]|nr:type II secretion system protein [Undibacterium sp.]
MKSKQHGFTLIELIVVITILGLLSAYALPRFAALQVEARIAKMNGALASLKAGANLAHSLQLTQQLGPAASVTMELQTILMNNAYPTTAVAAIGSAAGLSSPDYVLTATSATVFTVSSDASHPLCAVTYTVPTALGAPPTYSNAGVVAANCT